MKSIREVLTGHALVTISVDSSALDAAKLMDQAKVGALIVVDGENHPRGVFTERDLMIRVVVAGLDPGKTQVETVMTRDLYTAQPDRRINEVWREMLARHIRHLPVVDEENHLIGMLSLRDLLREHLDTKRQEVQVLTAYIQGDEGQLPPPTNEESSS